jgi:hypothetical protein
LEGYSPGNMLASLIVSGDAIYCTRVARNADAVAFIKPKFTGRSA